MATRNRCTQPRPQGLLLDDLQNDGSTDRLLPSIRHFENRRGEGPGDEVAVVLDTCTVQNGAELGAPGDEYNGRVPFDQNFRKSRFKIEWNRHFPEIRFENFGSPLEIVLFSGNLEITEISCSIWHFYPVWICPSSFSREKLQDRSEPFESTLYWMQNNVPQFEPVLDCLFSTLGIVDWSFRISWGLVCSVCILPGQTFPREKFASCSHHAKMVFESVR